MLAGFEERPTAVAGKGCVIRIGRYVWRVSRTPAAHTYVCCMPRRSCTASYSIGEKTAYEKTTGNVRSIEMPEVRRNSGTDRERAMVLEEVRKTMTYNWC